MFCNPGLESARFLDARRALLQELFRHRIRYQFAGMGENNAAVPVRNKPCFDQIVRIAGSNQIRSDAII